MKFLGQICTLVLVLAVSFTLIGCGGGKKASKASKPAASNVKLDEAQTYDYGVTFAAPEGWKAASRQSKTIVMFKNPNRDGQSVYIKVPENAQIKTLATKEDAEKAGLKGNLIQVGDYAWMSKTQVSEDKNEDKFDNLICTTIQFGKVYTVTVRGFQNQNDNCDGIMNAVLSKIKFSETTEAPQENIEEIDDFGKGFSL